MTTLRIRAQVRKELTQIRRDRLGLTLALGLPMILLALLGTAISLDVRDMKLAIQDLDQTPQSRALSAAVASSLSFQVLGLPDGMSPETALREGYARAVIVLPPHFEHDLARGFPTSIQAMVDATDTNTANLIKGKLLAILGSFNSQISPPVVSVGLISAQSRLWFNPGRDSHKYYGPGILVLALSIFPPLMAVLAAAREGEQRTILQVYVSSISAHEFLLGKILAGQVIGTAEWVLLVAEASLIFGIRFAGDPIPFLVGTGAFLFCGVSFGTLIGMAIPSQSTALQILSMASFMFAMLLSGLIYPIANIPAGLRWVSDFVQARFYIDVVRDTFLRGSGWSATWFDVLAISLLGGAFYFIAWLRIRRMQVD
jgi:ABC-2 type transport system permease protein